MELDAIRLNGGGLGGKIEGDAVRRDAHRGDGFPEQLRQRERLHAPLPRRADEVLFDVEDGARAALDDGEVLQHRVHRYPPAQLARRERLQGAVHGFDVKIVCGELVGGLTQQRGVFVLLQVWRHERQQCVGCYEISRQVLPNARDAARNGRRLVPHPMDRLACCQRDRLIGLGAEQRRVGLFQIVQQPGVVDGDGELICQRLQGRDVVLAEGVLVRALHRQRADDGASNGERQRHFRAREGQ